MPTVLGGIDRAAFAVAFANHLRGKGIPVSMTSMAAFTAALDTVPPTRLDALYWASRLTLVHRHRDLAVFELVFDAVFRDTVLAVDPNARRTGLGEQRPDDVLEPMRGARTGDGEPSDLPWTTLPRAVSDEDVAPDEDDRLLPELLPSADAKLTDTPFDELDERELALLGRWLERALPRWPTRKGRRMHAHDTGGRVAIRATIAASRRTGWEPIRLRRLAPVPKPLPVTLLTDVSESMRGDSTAYLHLMRAFARTRRAEVFAFSTRLTRLTPALMSTSPGVAIDRASSLVVDRFGGTRLASSLTELLRSRQASVVRDGVLVIASDGWDADPPNELAAALVRARRRSRRIVWLNPRASAPGFEPLVGSMAAALPFCDAFLPAHRLRDLPAVFDAIADTA